MIDRARFEREGFLAGIPTLSAEEIARYRPKLLGLYDSLPAALHKHFINLHGVLDWAAALGRHPAILDAVEALVGPDILLWKSKAFVKFPGPAQVAWHQDLPHWNLVPAEAVTAWLALSDSNEGNGCVRAIPGSHRAGSRASEAVRDPNSLSPPGSSSKSRTKRRRAPCHSCCARASSRCITACSCTARARIAGRRPGSASPSFTCRRMCVRPRRRTATSCWCAGALRRSTFPPIRRPRARRRSSSLMPATISSA
jgi:hypothetical protein